MTNEEVLSGATALSREDGEYIYTVTAEENTIILAVKRMAEGRNIFRYVAHLNGDCTYTETHTSGSGGGALGGKSASTSASVRLSLNRDSQKIDLKTNTFNSEDAKRIVRDYLEGCGYTKAKAGIFRRLFHKR